MGDCLQDFSGDKNVNNFEFFSPEKKPELLTRFAIEGNFVLWYDKLP